MIIKYCSTSGGGAVPHYAVTQKPGDKSGMPPKHPQLMIRQGLEGSSLGSGKGEESEPLVKGDDPKGSKDDAEKVGGGQQNPAKDKPPPGAGNNGADAAGNNAEPGEVDPPKGGSQHGKEQLGEGQEQELVKGDTPKGEKGGAKKVGGGQESPALDKPPPGAGNNNADAAGNNAEPGEVDPPGGGASSKKKRQGKQPQGNGQENDIAPSVGDWDGGEETGEGEAPGEGQEAGGGLDGAVKGQGDAAGEGTKGKEPKGKGKGAKAVPGKGENVYEGDIGGEPFDGEDGEPPGGSMEVFHPRPDAPIMWEAEKFFEAVDPEASYSYRRKTIL